MMTQQVRTLAIQRPDANVLSQSPTELLPMIMQVNARENPQVWMWRARDLLQDAMNQSRCGAPEHVSRAVEAWSVGSAASLEWKSSLIHGIQTYLEDVLAASLRDARVNAAPFDAPREGGIPILRSLWDRIEVSGSDPVNIRALMDEIPYPIAFAKLLGDEGLGTLLDSNSAMNVHFGWKRVSLASRDKKTGVRGLTIKLVLHPDNFAVARILLLRPGGTFRPSKMKFLRGEFRNVDPRQRMEDRYYVNCTGAGVVGSVGAFGIFTDLADSVGMPRPKI